MNRVLLTLIVLAATYFRLRGLDFQSLWIDELFTLETVRSNTAAEAFENYLAFEMAPPFYFFLQYLWHQVIPITDWSLRLPAAIYGVACIPAAFLLGRRIQNEGTGIIAALVLSVAPVAIVYSQEARPYSLLSLLTILCLSAYIAYSGAPSRKTGVGYFSLAFLLSQTHVYGIYAVLILGIFCLFRFRRDRQLFVVTALGHILLALLLVPWFLTIVQSGKTSITYLPPPNLETLSERIYWLLGAKKRLVVLLLILLTFSLTHKRSRILVAFLLSTFFLAYTIAQLNSAFTNRYLTFAIGPIFVLAASGIDFFSRKVRWLGGALALAVVLLNLGSLNSAFQPYTVPSKMQFREASTYAMEQLSRDPKAKIIVFAQGPNLFDYYLTLKGLPRNRLVFLSVPGDIPPLSEWPEEARRAEKIILLSAVFIEDTKKIDGLMDHFKITDQQDFYELKVYVLKKI